MSNPPPRDMHITWSEVPAYTAALEKENILRDAAFFLPTERLAVAPYRTLDLAPLSALRFLILDNVGCPFIRGRRPVETDVALFLWVCSSQFVAGAGRLRDRFIKRECRPVSFDTACAAIYAYLDEALLDAPGAAEAASGRPTDSSWVAPIVDRFASEYGWSEETILNLPLKRIWQYLRCIRKRHDPDAVFINSLTQKAQREHWCAMMAGDAPSTINSPTLN